MDAPDTVLERPAPRTEARPPGQGTSFGRYVLLEVLGSGGMGTVHAAYDSQLDRKVAIKMLHRSLLQDDSVGHFSTRMLREAQAMARLAHPNVVAVHDVGTFEGTVFLAMEYVKGSTLRKWLQAPRPLAERLAVLKAAGRGLAAAHAAGIVHRDFKPDNVLVGSDGRVCVTDFGIARGAELSVDETSGPAPGAPSIEAESAELAVGPVSAVTQGALLDAPITRSGSILGSVGYMAPEQARGERADARADQFGFCAALYFALYGVRPFPARELGAYIASLEGPVAPAPADTSVPSWLRRVVLRGLSASPDARYPTMDALLQALDEDPALRRRRWFQAGAVAAGMALAGILLTRAHAPPPALCTGAEATVSATWGPAKRAELEAAFARLPAPGPREALTRTETILDEYARGLTEMRTEACVATRVRGEQSDDILGLRMGCLDDRMREVSALVSALGKGDAATLERAPEAAQALGQVSVCADVPALTAPVRPPNDAVTRARVDDVRGRIATSTSENRLGHYAAARDVATAAAKDAESIRYAPVQAEALFALGDAQVSFGAGKDARATLLRAEVAAVAGNDAVMATLSLAALVAADSGLGRFEEAHVLADLGEAWGARANGAAQGELASSVGRLLYAERRLDDARVALERAISLQTAALGKSDVRVAWSVTLLADVYLALGDYGGAKAENERAIAIIEAAGGRQSALVAPNLNNLGGVCFDNADYDCAIGAFRRAHEVYERAYGRDFFANAVTLSNLAEATRARGDPEGALPLNEEAVGIVERLFGKSEPGNAALLVSLAETQRLAGEDARALTTFQRALAIEEKALGHDHADLASPLSGVGLVRLDQKRPDLARAPLTRALALREAHPGDPFDRAETRFALARALAGTMPARARALASQARAELASAGPRGAKRTEEIGAWLAAL